METSGIGVNRYRELTDDHDDDQPTHYRAVGDDDEEMNIFTLLVFEMMATNQDETELELLAPKAMYWDEVSGVELPRQLIAKARSDELAFFKSWEAFRECGDDECMRVARRRPISRRWKDINKGDADNVNVRSRLIARQFRSREMERVRGNATPQLDQVHVQPRRFSFPWRRRNAQTEYT